MSTEIKSLLGRPAATADRPRSRPVNQGRLTAASDWIVREALESAGIQIDGDRPWDLRVWDNRFYRRVLRSGSIGLGDSYVDGWWDAPQLDEFFHWLLRAGLDQRHASAPGAVWNRVAPALVNLQSRFFAFRNARHYDLGNDLYRAMLDSRMVYTCGYWENARTLDAAQEAKLDLVCRKLGIGPGMTVLDIGCGWASLARHAAERYGARVTGVTVSREQAEHGRQYCRGLPVDIHLLDYRDVDGTYDRVVSLGMFEHVGSNNYRTFMRVVRDRLRDDGLFLLHTIGGNRSVRSIDPWIGRHIFPNAMLPSIAQVGRAAEDLFVMEDWENFGADYDRTLTAWFRNFDAHWPALRPRYGDRFHRMWKYYLLSCAGSFRARKNQVWQIVMSPAGLQGGYRPPDRPGEIHLSGGHETRRGTRFEAPPVAGGKEAT